MSVLAGLITAVWQLFKKRNKRKENSCAKILDKNKTVEQFKDKAPLLKADYTEERWDQINASMPEPIGHYCDLNCRCQIIKEYTKALNEGDKQKAKEIIQGDYKADKIIIEVYEVEPKVKLSRKDIERLQRSMDKIDKEIKSRHSSEHSQKPNNPSVVSSYISCNKAKTKTSTTPVHKPRRIKCCSNDNCGCHVVKEFTRAQREGNEELMAQIVKGMHFDPNFVSDNFDKSHAKKEETNSTPNTQGLKQTLPKDMVDDKNKINCYKASEISTRTETVQGSSSETKVVDVSKYHGANLNNMPVKESTSTVSIAKHVSDNVKTSSFGSENTYTSLDNTHDVPLNNTKLDSDPNHSHPDLDTSFHHTIPHYYAENENAINQMKHAKKTKKRKKITKTIKTKNVIVSKKHIELERRSGRVKRYNSLMEEDSDSSFTDETGYMDSFTTS